VSAEPREWLTHSGEETAALAAQLLGMPGRLLSVGAAGRDAPCRVVTLSGELGSGKSTFARGALRALGVGGTIKSPSYTLLETYELPAIHAVHLDLYRLTDPNELEHLGLADYHRPGFLWLVEWPERGAGRLPAPDLQFEFSITEQGHRIERIDILAANK
jgi:tRNA threonylcarbamoyladenosine biosynthesis protein TsaE